MQFSFVLVSFCTQTWWSNICFFYLPPELLVLLTDPIMAISNIQNGNKFSMMHYSRNVTKIKMSCSEYDIFMADEIFNSLRQSDAYICISKLAIIGSDHGLLAGQGQAIIWTSDGILLTRNLGTNFSKIFSEIHTFSFKKMHLKMSLTSVKWWVIFSWPQCVNSLRPSDAYMRQ